MVDRSRWERLWNLPLKLAWKISPVPIGRKSLMCVVCLERLTEVGYIGYIGFEDNRWQSHWHSRDFWRFIFYFQPTVSALNGEQRKRVTIGVELAGLPRILFLDEPTSVRIFTVWQVGFGCCWCKQNCVCHKKSCQNWNFHYLYNSPTFSKGIFKVMFRFRRTDNH